MPESPESLIVSNQLHQDVNLGQPPRQGGLATVDVTLAQHNKCEIPTTALGTTQNQSQGASPQAALSSQPAAGLSLLHVKPGEISDLQVQVNAVREATNEDGAKGENKRAESGVLHLGEVAEYLVAGVQTGQEDDDAALAVFDSERALWAEERKETQRVAEALRADKVRALADVDLFREQYQRASEFASKVRSENEELSARAALAESQSVNGIAMIRATFEVRVAKLEDESRRYKALSEMLIERARRTDDDVRYRAAMAPEFEREYQQLHRQFRETEAVLEEIKDELRSEKKMNARLRRHIVGLEAKEEANGGNPHEQEIASWNDEREDGDYLPPSTNSAQSNNDDMIYLCRWRSGETTRNCNTSVASKQELREHVLSHHLTCH
ncbi:hypothetical protein B0F90DRAFT_1723960 [Multifurca ochricompacta]|uniref:Uncharacterized protein n=1 Tax=Multifurca ochricompacta TaxID=376703 RepID=A0AAD4M3L1_9AGAM|nr:hypothetical protein B0F90DRAFT_1723960 [Multifurca ochricompacta]